LAGSISPNIKVIRNDELTVTEIGELSPSHIILSPGPGYPANAGVCEDLVYSLAGKVPILGVCLGHQGICEVYGAEITHAKRLMHGRKSTVKIDNASPIFQGLPPYIEAARYHSLAARKENLPAVLQVIAADEEGEVMAVKHDVHAIYGLQFHPESILTPCGHAILKNFLNLEEEKKC
jgi:anthranilate synthase component 2